MMQDRIQDILNHKKSDVWCICSDATISEAAQRMREHNIGTLFVVGHNQVMGMLSEHDIVFHVLARGKDPCEIQVSDIMTAVPTVGLDTLIEVAYKLANAAGADQIVVQDSKHIVGVIATKEMARWMNLERDFRISDLTAYITGRAAPPRISTGPRADESQQSEARCAYCGAVDDEATWELGVALCRSCAPPSPDRMPPNL